MYGTYVVEINARVIAHGADGRHFHQTIIVAAFHLLSTRKSVTSKTSVSVLTAMSH